MQITHGIDELRRDLERKRAEKERALLNEAHLTYNAQGAEPPDFITLTIAAKEKNLAARLRRAMTGE
jgi:hypothetical protein